MRLSKQRALLQQLVAGGTVSAPVTTPVVPANTPILTDIVRLTAGTVVVPNNKITADTIIRLTQTRVVGVPGAVYVSAKTGAASFTITSTSATDTSFIMYEILKY